MFILSGSRCSFLLLSLFTSWKFLLTNLTVQNSLLLTRIYLPFHSCCGDHPILFSLIFSLSSEELAPNPKRNSFSSSLRWKTSCFAHTQCRHPAAVSSPVLPAYPIHKTQHSNIFGLPARSFFHHKHAIGPLNHFYST